MRVRRLFLAMSLALVAGLAPLLVLGGPASGAGQLPSGFGQSRLVDGLFRPTAMAFAPDGRLFVAEQDGAVRVVKDGQLLPGPFLRFPASKIDSQKERGLLGIAFDPAFATNHYVYVYYTLRGTSTTPPRNRILRFTASGDRAVSGSMRPVFELESLGSFSHNGGAIHFGRDRRLYVAVGDNGTKANAQSLKTIKGKILRINADGSIPSDNPFGDRTNGRNEAIWALGFRNPFSFAVQPGTGRTFVNDVGSSEQVRPVPYEEVNELGRGSNYGWPYFEGPEKDPRYRPPVYAYAHTADISPCAITGGTFYDPAVPTFLTEYVGDYFFADFCGGWIRQRDSHGRVVEFKGSDADRPVDLAVGPDGSLYYLARETGAVERISYTAP